MTQDEIIASLLICGRADVAAVADLVASKLAAPDWRERLGRAVISGDYPDGTRALMIEDIDRADTATEAFTSLVIRDSDTAGCSQADVWAAAI